MFTPRFACALWALTMMLLLAACGGGGGSSTTPGGNSGGTNSATGTGTGGSGDTPSVQYTAPNVSVPAPTYAASSAQATFFADINAMRGASGLSLLAQNSALDTSAQTHANYLGLNYNASTMSGIDPTTGLLYAHSEDVGMPGFYADTPKARATKAGYTGFATEVTIPRDKGGTAVPNSADVGHEAFNILMNTVYHRGAMMQDNLRDIGIGYASPYEFNVDMGYTGTPQPPDANTLVPFPADGGVDPYPYWPAGFEHPNPTPTVAEGTPMGGAISIQSPSFSALSVTSFQLLDDKGAPVACFELDRSNDPKIARNQAFLIPKANLNLASRYTAVFSGAINGVPAQKSWTFTTPNATLQQITTGPYVLHNGGSVTIRFKAPSGYTGFNFSVPSSIPMQALHSDISLDSITLSLAPGAVSSSNTITVIMSDLKYPSVPKQTVTVTAEP